MSFPQLIKPAVLLDIPIEQHRVVQTDFAHFSAKIPTTQERAAAQCIADEMDRYGPRPSTPPRPEQTNYIFETRRSVADKRTARRAVSARYT